jgi:high-affinity iron transporter
MEFEPIERRLATRDAALVAEIEREFARLRGEVGSGRGETADFTTLIAKLRGARIVLAGERGGYVDFANSLLIIVREGLEVILIVSALAAYLSKGGHVVALRWLYGGAVVGVVSSIATAVLLDLLLENVAVGKELLEGITMLVAAVMLFFVSYWLISKVEARHWQHYIQRSLNRALGRGSRAAMAGVAFLAVYREGFETVLFYRALAADAPALPVVVGFLVGCCALAALWVGISFFSLRIPLKQFFGLTGTLLYVLAFRFLGSGIAELQGAGVVDFTPVVWWPDFAPLAMSANLETGLVQLTLIAAAAVALFVALSVRRRAEAVH